MRIVCGLGVLSQCTVCTVYSYKHVFGETVEIPLTLVNRDIQKLIDRLRWAVEEEGSLLL